MKGLLFGQAQSQLAVSDIPNFTRKFKSRLRSFRVCTQVFLQISELESLVFRLVAVAYLR